MEKIGMQREGTMRPHYIDRGKANDYVYRGLLREEWEQAREPG